MKPSTLLMFLPLNPSTAPMDTIFCMFAVSVSTEGSRFLFFKIEIAATRPYPPQLETLLIINFETLVFAGNPTSSLDLSTSA